MLQPFEKWAIDFVGAIQLQGKKTGVRYIITAIEYLTRWVEAQPMKDYMGAIAGKFLFDALTEEFQVYHQKRMPYYLQAHGTVEAFNKVLENALIKVFNAQRSDWDLCIPVVLWAYQMTCKKLTRQTPFGLVYGVEAVMPMEYIMPSLCIAALTGMKDRGALEERLTQLVELEEEIFLAGFHQQVQKQHKKAWHDRPIKLRNFKVNDMVLLYDRKFDKFSRKFRMPWLGPYVIKEITDNGAFQLIKSNGDPFTGKVNGSRLNPYTSDPAR
eukprot:PITA_17500